MCQDHNYCQEPQFCFENGFVLCFALAFYVSNDNTKDGSQLAIFFLPPNEK